MSRPHSYRAVYITEVSDGFALYSWHSQVKNINDTSSPGMPTRDVRDGALIAVQSTQAPSKLGSVVAATISTHYPRPGAQESHGELGIDESSDKDRRCA